MAETTLNDVIDTMRNEEQLTRSSSADSFKSAIGEIKGVRSDFKGFFNNFGGALESLGSTQKDFSEMMKSNFEKQQEALASQQREDSLENTPKPVNTDDSKGAISKLLKSIKGMIPKKTPGLIGLLFGGAAATLLFFPEWVKENIINPLIDVIDVLLDPDIEPKTLLGKITKGIGTVFTWLNDNIHPKAGWIVGGIAAAAILTPGFLKLFGGLLAVIGSFAMAHPVITAATLAVYGLIKAFDFFKALAIKNELEIAKKFKARYDNAKNDDDKRAIALEAASLRNRLVGSPEIKDIYDEIAKTSKPLFNAAADAAKTKFMDAEKASITADTKYKRLLKSGTSSDSRAALAAEKTKKQRDEARNDWIKATSAEFVAAFAKVNDRPQLLNEYKKQFASAEDSARSMFNRVPGELGKVMTAITSKLAKVVKDKSKSTNLPPDRNAEKLLTAELLRNSDRAYLMRIDDHLYIDDSENGLTPALVPANTPLAEKNLTPPPKEPPPVDDPEEHMRLTDDEIRDQILNAQKNVAAMKAKAKLEQVNQMQYHDQTGGAPIITTLSPVNNNADNRQVTNNITNNEYTIHSAMAALGWWDKPVTAQ